MGLAGPGQHTRVPDQIVAGHRLWVHLNRVVVLRAFVFESVRETLDERDDALAHAQLIAHVSRVHARVSASVRRWEDDIVLLDVAESQKDLEDLCPEEDDLVLTVSPG